VAAASASSPISARLTALGHDVTLLPVGDTLAGSRRCTQALRLDPSIPTRRH
jgi:hypothetical protein